MEKKSSEEWFKFFSLCYEELAIQRMSDDWVDLMDELIITDEFVDGLLDELEDEDGPE